MDEKRNAAPGSQPDTAEGNTIELSESEIACIEAEAAEYEQLQKAFAYSIEADAECQRRYEIVRKRRRNFVVFRRGVGNKTKRFLAQKECSRFAVSDA